MSGKLNLYGWLGVNVDKSEVHLEDGELTKSQNWINSDRVSGGLRKRPGLTKINSSAGGSGTSVTGAISSAHTQTLTNTFYAGIQAISAGSGTPSSTWRTSTNGTSWSAATSPARPAHITNITVLSVSEGYARCISFNGKLYWAGDDYTVASSSPTIHQWDGTTDIIVGTIPYNIAAGAGTFSRGVTCMAPYDASSFLIATQDDASGAGLKTARVLLFNPTTGTFTQLGPTAAVGSTEFAGHQVTCMVHHSNRVWLGTLNYGSGTGKIYFIRPTQDTTWTLDTTLGAAYNVESLCVYKGELYVGTNAVALGNPGIIYVRSTVGAYTASLTFSNNTSGYSTTSAMVAGNSRGSLGDNLYALTFDDGIAAVQNRPTIRKYDGTSWTTVYTLGDLGASRAQNRFGMGIVGPDNAAYFIIAEQDAGASADVNSDGLILRSTNGTTWTEVDQITNLHGVIGFTRT